MTTTERLAAYQDAERRVLLGQRINVAGRDFTLADLAVIRTGIAELERRLRSETAAAAGRSGYAVADFSGREC